MFFCVFKSKIYIVIIDRFIMDYHGLLKKDFGIKDREISILISVENKKLNAKDICLQTGIQKGRIYEYLNNLIQKNLIERTTKKPYSYFVSDPVNNILLFMKKRIDNMLESQSEIIKIMEKGGKEYIEKIDNGEKFTYTHLNMISSGKDFRMIGVHDSFPFFLYPDNFDDFLKLRNLISAKRATISFTDSERIFYIYKTYKEAMKENVKMTVVFEYETLIKHMKMIEGNLGKAFLNKMIKDCARKICAGTNKAYVIKEYLPFQIDINDRCVSVSIKHRGITNGFVLYSQDAVKMYNLIFEQHIERSKPLLPILRKLSRGK